MEDTKAKPDALERDILDRLVWSHERSRTRLIVALIVAMALLAAWGIVETVLRHKEHSEWLEFMAGYDFECYDYAQDGQGVNIIGDGNGVTNYQPAFARAEDEQEGRRIEPRQGDP